MVGNTDAIIKIEKEEETAGPEVDSVTGATLTSEDIKNAVAEAVKEAK